MTSALAAAARDLVQANLARDRACMVTDKAEGQPAKIGILRDYAFSPDGLVSTVVIEVGANRQRTVIQSAQGLWLDQGAAIDESYHRLTRFVRAEDSLKRGLNLAALMGDSVMH